MAIKLGIESYSSKIHIVSEIDYFRQAHSGINHKAEVNIIGKAELIVCILCQSNKALFSGANDVLGVIPNNDYSLK